MFAPWDILRDEVPEWVHRGFWYDGCDGYYIVVYFDYCDDPGRWFSGKIMRFVNHAHAVAEFKRHAQADPDSFESSAGVYLFDGHKLLQQAGGKFSEYTGLPELPDNRW